MGQTRWTVAVLFAAAVAVLGACGSGSPARVVAKAHQPAETTTSTSAPVVAADTTVAPTPVTSSPTHSTTAKAGRSAAPTHSSTAAATSGGSTSTAAASPAFAPAAPGVYNYSTSGSSSSMLGKVTFPSTTTLTVDAAQGTRQHSVRRLVNPNGDGLVVEQTLDYQPQGVAVVSQKLTMTQSGNTTTKSLSADPTTVVLPVGLAIGGQRAFDLSGSGLTAHEVVSLVQATTTSVAGQSVSGVLMRTVLTLTGGVSGSIQLDQTWAPSVRVPLVEHLSGSIKSGMVSVKTAYDATLTNLQP